MRRPVIGTACALLWCTLAHAQCLGDSNGDGSVTVADMMTTMHAIFSAPVCQPPPTVCTTRYVVAGTLLGHPATGEVLVGPAQSATLWPITLTVGTFTGAGAIAFVHEQVYVSVTGQISGAFWGTLQGWADPTGMPNWDQVLLFSGDDGVLELGPLVQP